MMFSLISRIFGTGSPAPEETLVLSRRRFLTGVGAVGCVLAAGPVLLSPRKADAAGAFPPLPEDILERQNDVIEVQQGYGQGGNRWRRDGDRYRDGGRNRRGDWWDDNRWYRRKRRWNRREIAWQCRERRSFRRRNWEMCEWAMGRSRRKYRSYRGCVTIGPVTICE